MRLLVLHPRDARPHEPGFQNLLDGLNGQVIARITDLGWDAELLPSRAIRLEEHLAALDETDAVIVMGGEDVDPVHYGGATSYESQTSHEPEADAAQLRVIRECIARGIPLLGICRGHQLLNVACGGDLIQHMTEPAAHRNGADGDKFTTVDVLTRADTDLAASIPPRQSVRCAHHQAVGTLGAGLVAAATAPDGTIEAVVHESAPATGVQWHPEHSTTSHEQLTALLLRLAEQSARRAPHAVSVEAPDLV